MKPYTIWIKNLDIGNWNFVQHYDSLEDAARSVEIRKAYDKGRWSHVDYDYCITKNIVIDINYPNNIQDKRIITL